MTLRWNKSLILAYQNTFNSPEGKKVLEDLKKKAPLLTGGVGPSPDMNTLLLLEGQSNVIKHIYKMLSRDPNAEAVEHARNENNIL